MKAHLLRPFGFVLAALLFLVAVGQQSGIFQLSAIGSMSGIQADAIKVDGNNNLLRATPSADLESTGNYARTNTFIKNPAVQFGGVTINDPKLADVDGDGDLDVFANQEGSPYGVAYYKNDGSGNFAAATVIPGINDANFYLGDLDGDGDVDIVVPTNWTSQTFGKVFLNDGAGNFTVMPGSFIGSHAYYPLGKIVDINKDGLNDIIYCGIRMPDGAWNTEIWLNTGSIGHPNFALAQTIQNYTPTGNSLAVEDIDGDGDLDMVSGANSWPALVYVNNGGTFADPYEISGYASSVFLIDWDNDGDKDLLMYDAYNNSGLHLHRNDGHGNFEPTGKLLFDRTQTGFNLDQNERFELADVNKDGYPDAVLTDGVNGTRVLYNTGCSFVLQSYILGKPAANSYVSGMAVGDVDNDGFPDVITTFGANDAAVYLNDLLQATAVPLSNITATTGATICSNGTVTLNAVASNNGTINWYDLPSGGGSLATGSSYSVSVTATTVYYVDATNSNGCVSARVPVTATIGQAPVVSITSSGSSVCGSSTVTLTASAGASYLWNNGETTQSITVNTAGNYTVKVTNASGCSAKSAPFAVTSPANTSTFTTLSVDADIQNTGQLIAANNLGAGASPVSINGVCFSNSPANLTNFANGGGAFCQDCIPGSNLKKLLDALVFQPNGNESTLTLGGLTSCHRYRLQLIYSNDVNSTGNNINVNVNGVTYSYSNWIPAAKILTVEFTASSASTVVRFLANNGAEPNRAVLNGYAIHDLDMPNSGPCNAAPVANAGADINAGAGANCVANITLNGSGSTDADGVNTIVSYTWKEGQTVLGTGISLSTNLSIGTHTVILEVKDNWGVASTDTVVIKVADATPPSIVCTANITTSAVNAAGAVVNYTVPVGTDNCSAVTTTRTAGLASGSVFPIGSTTVTYTATDATGLSSSCSFTVNVTGLPPAVNCPQNILVNTAAGQCGANVDFAATETQANPAAVLSYTENGNAVTSGSFFTTGTHTITATATNTIGSSSCSFTINVKDIEKPTVTAPAPQVFCFNSGNQYTIPSATGINDNCAVSTTSYSITGAISRSGNGSDASGIFGMGTSTITWTVTDTNGNTNTASTTVTINPLPSASFVSSNADAFCNKVSVTGSSSINPSTYSWSTTNSAGTFSNNAQLNLGLTDADGNYYLYVKSTATSCVSAVAAVYNYQKQNLSSSYTILAYKEIELGKFNKVVTGSVGVMTTKGEAEFKSNTSVNGPGAFVKSPKIDKDGSGILITNQIVGVASVSLPAMQLNTANTNNLPNYTASVNNATIAGNYKNLTVKKGISVTVAGNTFGSIRLEEGASIRFSASILNIDALTADKGAKNNNYSYIRFAPNTSVRISGKVSIGSQVFVNPESNKVTFYMGDLKNDEEKFTVKGGDTRVIANIYMPDGKLRVTATDSDDDDHDNCDHKAHDARNCKHKGHDHNDCDHKAHSAASCNDDVYMTGLFIAEEVESKGNTVIWNSYDCSAPAPVVNAINNKGVQQMAAVEKTATVTIEEELKVTVMPNPSTTYFTLKLESKYETPVSMRVMDANGRVVDAKSQLGSNSTVQVGQNYSSGTYYAELIQGTKQKVVQLIKLK